MTTYNQNREAVKIGMTIILNRNGKKTLAKVSDIFSDCVGLQTLWASMEGISKDYYRQTVAFYHEIEPNKTGWSIKF